MSPVAVCALSLLLHLVLSLVRSPALSLWFALPRSRSGLLSRALALLLVHHLLVFLDHRLPHHTVDRFLDAAVCLGSTPCGCANVHVCVLCSLVVRFTACLRKPSARTQKRSFLSSSFSSPCIHYTLALYATLCSLSLEALVVLSVSPLLLLLFSLSHLLLIACTLPLLHNSTFKRRAGRAVREVKKFASQTMGTDDVRITNELNQFLWSKGVRNVPYRVRVRLDRKRDADEEDSHSYTVVDVVPVETFKGLTSKRIEVEA
jgi:large subunit ribosomal protein L31e